MLLIYTIKVTPRLQYIADLLLRELLELDFEFTNSTIRFYQYDGPKINYSKEKTDEEIFIHSHSLLFETDIKQQRLEYSEHHGVATIFSSDNEGDLPYDPFAAAFFFVSRYEEYLEFKEDKYKRYRAEKGAAYYKGFHGVPVVNHYAQHLKQILQKRFPDLVFPSKEYQFILTYDIDQAYKFSNLNWYRMYGGFLKATIKRDKDFIIQRKKVLSGSEQDPFNTFDFQFRLNNKYRIYPIYFFLMANYGSLDKNNVWNSYGMKQLIKNISDKYLIGIHPGFKSFDKPKNLEMEIARLNAVTGKQIVRSRQHFLRLKFPDTYRNLIEHGIEEDYTMGHPNILGFRAGIASPFYFFDLRRDETTSLRVFPFAAMDSTLHYYMKVTPESALDELKLLVDEVKKIQGTFIFIAHNDLIGKQSLWKGWQPFYEEFIQYAKE